jgi:hypothetical protein
LTTSNANTQINRLSVNSNIVNPKECWHSKRDACKRRYYYTHTLTVDSVQVIHKRWTTSNESLFRDIRKRGATSNEMIFLVIRKRGTTSNETLCVLSDIIKWLYILFGLFATVLTHKYTVCLLTVILSTQNSACILKEMPVNKDITTLIHYLLIVFGLSTKGGQPAMKRFFWLSAKGGQPAMKHFCWLSAKGGQPAMLTHK